MPLREPETGTAFSRKLNRGGRSGVARRNGRILQTGGVQSVRNSRRSTEGFSESSTKLK